MMICKSNLKLKMGGYRIYNPFISLTRIEDIKNYLLSKNWEIKKDIDGNFVYFYNEKFKDDIDNDYIYVKIPTHNEFNDIYRRKEEIIKFLAQMYQEKTIEDILNEIDLLKKQKKGGQKMSKTIEDYNVFNDIHGLTSGLLRIITCDYIKGDNFLNFETKGKMSELRKEEIDCELNGEVYFQFFPNNSEEEVYEKKKMLE